jgi:hypothetical protein
MPAQHVHVSLSFLHHHDDNAASAAAEDDDDGFSFLVIDLRPQTLKNTVLGAAG